MRRRSRDAKGPITARAWQGTLALLASVLIGSACRDAPTQTSAAPTTSVPIDVSADASVPPGADEPAPVSPPPSGPPRPRGTFVDDPEAAIQMATSSCHGKDRATDRPCPLYVMEVERDGTVSFRGSAYVRLREAKARLSEAQTRALFALVTDGVWGPPVEGSPLVQEREAPVRFSFRFVGGPREIAGDRRCAPEGQHHDRFTQPTQLCDIENALRRVALPFTDCDGKDCPRVPDPSAEPKPMPPPVESGMGMLEVDCPRCRKITVYGQSGPSRRVELGKSPARANLPAGSYSISLERARGGGAVYYRTLQAGQKVVITDPK